MEEWPSNGARPKRMAQRKCLKCDVEFQAKDRFHRLCDPCKCINAGIADVEIELPEELLKKLRFHHYYRRK